jgi:hypothetical protein
VDGFSRSLWISASSTRRESPDLADRFSRYAAPDIRHFLESASQAKPLVGAGGAVAQPRCEPDCYGASFLYMFRSCGPGKSDEAKGSTPLEDYSIGFDVLDQSGAIRFTAREYDPSVLALARPRVFDSDKL